MNGKCEFQYLITGYTVSPADPGGELGRGWGRVGGGGELL